MTLILVSCKVYLLFPIGLFGSETKEKFFFGSTLPDLKPRSMNVREYEVLGVGMGCFSGSSGK